MHHASKGHHVRAGTASAKDIAAWAREVTGGRCVIAVHLQRQRVIIEVDGVSHTIAARAIDFAQVAQALLRLGPSCAQEGAETKR